MNVDGFAQAPGDANDRPHGLPANVYASSRRRGMELSFGELYVNSPCGELVQVFHTGWKHSGLGGQDGQYDFDGYLRKQTTYVRWS